MIHSSAPASPREVAAHYDALDAFYRQVWGDHVHHGLWRTGRESRHEALRALCHAVAAEVAAPRGAAVCDIGCGYGATARLLAPEYGWQMTAVTVSPAQTHFAKQLEPGAANPVYLCADWLHSGLPDHAFDGAFAVESSEHMPDLAAFFREAHRTLRPGARLVVTAWLSADAPTRWQRRHLLEPICREAQMPIMGTAEDYRRTGESAGFRLLRWQDLRRQVAPTWPRIVRTFLVKLARHPGYLRFLFRAHARNRIFGATILRLCLAYRVGAMRYGLFTFRKDE